MIAVQWISRRIGASRALSGRWVASSILTFCAALPACGSSTIGSSPDLTTSRSEQSDAVELNASNLIAKVELADNHAVMFHEVAPGQTEVFERMPRGTRGVLSSFQRDETPFEIYRAIKPGEAVPKQLALAEIRALDRMKSLEFAEPALVRPNTSGAGALIQDDQAPTPGRDLQHSTPDGDTAQQRHDHFSGHGYCLQGTPDEYDLNDQNEVCKFTNWGGGFWAERSAKSARFIVDLWEGESVQIAGIYNTGHCRDWFARQDEDTVFEWKLNCTAPGNVGRRIEVNNASGDHFHIGGSWWRP